MKSCLVWWCKNKSGSKPDLRFFKLTPERYKSWMTAIGRDPDVEKLSFDNVICSEHFLLEDLIVTNKRIELKPDSLPSGRRKLDRTQKRSDFTAILSVQKAKQLPVVTNSIESAEKNKPLEQATVGCSEPNHNYPFMELEEFLQQRNPESTNQLEPVSSSASIIHQSLAMKHSPILEAPRINRKRKYVNGTKADALFDAKKAWIQKSYKNVFGHVQLSRSSKKCLVRWCYNYMGPNPSKHFFKLTKERYHSWMIAIGRDPIAEPPVSCMNVICSDHFDRADLVVCNKKCFVKPGAIPVLKRGGEQRIYDVDKSNSTNLPEPDNRLATHSMAQSDITAAAASTSSTRNATETRPKSRRVNNKIQSVRSSTKIEVKTKTRRHLRRVHNCALHSKRIRELERSRSVLVERLETCTKQVEMLQKQVAGLQDVVEDLHKKNSTDDRATATTRKTQSSSMPAESSME